MKRIKSSIEKYNEQRFTIETMAKEIYYYIDKTLHSLDDDPRIETDEALITFYNEIHKIHDVILDMEEL